MVNRERRKTGLPRGSAGLRNAALALGSALLTVVAFELFVFHVLDIKPPGYAPERFFRYSPLTGHTLRPNSEGSWYRYTDGTKFHVRTNAFGFGDAERSLEKTRRRIALIGDSTTQFWEAEPHERGHVLLEERLGREYEVLNFGVRDFGTDQSLLLFEEVGSRFRPDIVIYTFCINDISDNARRVSKPYFVEDSGAPDGLSVRGQPVKTQPAWIEQHRERMGFWRMHSYLYRRTAPAAKRWLQKLRGGDAPIPPFIEVDPYRKRYSPSYASQVERTLQLISRLDRTVRLHGAKLLVVEGVYRPAMDEAWRRRIVAQHEDELDFDKPSRLLTRHTAAEGIAFLSLPRIARRRGIEASGLMHPEDVMHLDARGIRFQADAVAEKLRALGWVAGGAERG